MTSEDAAPTFGRGTYDFATGRWSWDAAMYEILGLDPDGRDAAEAAFERMNPDDVDRMTALLAAAVDRPGPFAGQYRIRDGRGQERSVAFVGDAAFDDDGSPVRLVGLGFDVTDEVRRSETAAVGAATRDRAAIEQVKGALMFAHGLDADTAFGLLCQWSQRGNVRVAVLARHAAEVLGRATVPGAPPPSIVDLLDEAVVAAGGRSVVHDLGRRPA